AVAQKTIAAKDRQISQLKQLVRNLQAQLARATKDEDYYKVACVLLIENMKLKKQLHDLRPSAWVANIGPTPWYAWHMPDGDARNVPFTICEIGHMTGTQQITLEVICGQNRIAT